MRTAQVATDEDLQDFTCSQIRLRVVFEKECNQRKEMEMAKQMSGHRPGGGSGSRQVVQKPVRTGQKATGMHVGGVSQLGEAVGNHVTNKSSTGYRGDVWRDGKVPTGGAQRLGNEVAASTKAGPGGSRTVYGCGSQQGISPTRSPNASTKDTLAEFGPDIPGRR
jgi:hypothetical protein